MQTATEAILDPVFDPNPAAFSKGGQRGYFEDWTHRFIALEGGLGAGKTVAGAYKLAATHALNAFDEKGNATFCASFIVGETYQNLWRFDVPKFIEACDSVGWTVKERRQDNELHIIDLGTAAKPSKVFLCSADRSERIAGFDAGAGWGDEAARWKVSKDGDPKNDPLIQSLGRLRDKRARVQQMGFTYTNEGDSTPIYQFMRMEGKADREWYTASTRDNQNNVGEFLTSQLSALPPALIEQYVDGHAVNLRGSHAYSCFNKDLHVSKERLKLSPGVPVSASFDFNIDPGMHVGIGQYDKSQARFIFTNEIHAPRMDVRSAVREFGALYHKAGGNKAFKGVIVYGDATGRGSWAGTGESCYTILFEELRLLGIRCKRNVPPNNPPVVDRVNSMQAALLDGRAETHVLIDPECKILIRDLERVKWDDKGKDLDKGSKDLTHMSDLFGYWVHRRRPLVYRRKTNPGRFSVNTVASGH